MAGCNEIAAQHAAPVRPVLVANVHYEAQARDRTFVGTIRPRIESELGFRVAGKVSKRLVEVALRCGCPKAMLVQKASEISWGQLDGIKTLGLTAGASAPEILVEEIIEKLKARFDVAIEPVRTATEDVIFKMPRALQPQAAQ